MNARSYDPAVDLDQLSPSWSIHVTSLAPGEDEIFVHSERRVLIDPARHGEAWMRAHVAAHLTLCHHLEDGRRFTAAQESDADALARGRIGMADRCGVELFELPPLDGDPSVPFSAL